MKKLAVLFLIFLALNGLFSDDMKLYKTALTLENEGKAQDAIKYYLEFVASSKDSGLNEKVFLKIARISESFDESVKYYKDFFNKYPASKYTSIARYELANLYKLKGNFKEALKEYSFIISNENEKIYYRQKANIFSAEIEIELEKFAFATERLYKLLDSVADYEDSGRIYYLLGVALLRQGMFKESEKFFLTSAGSFPLSSKSATSLYQLVLIYLKTGKEREALRIGKILTNLYPDSIEALSAAKSISKISDKNTDKIHGFELIDLNKDVDIKNNTNILIEKDFTESINNDIGAKNTEHYNADYYIQLGYFSTEENARLTIEEYQKNGVKDIFTAKTKANEIGKIFYRLVIGPFYERESANKKILELKEKNIEAIVLELAKIYE